MPGCRSHRRALPAPRAAALCSLALLALGPLTAAAQAGGERELLNSERIERAFGSYGIEIVDQSGTVRVSNLYSGTGDTRVTRTFAVVLFPADIDGVYADEHAEIVSGGSIGAVFTENGWTVRKRHRFFGTLDSTPRLERMMGGISPQTLATHVYALEVAKGGAQHEYARIVEIHHPDYLAPADVRSIYGDAYEPPVTLSGLTALADALRLAAARTERSR